MIRYRIKKIIILHPTFANWKCHHYTHSHPFHLTSVLHWINFLLHFITTNFAYRLWEQQQHVDSKTQFWMPDFWYPNHVISFGEFFHHINFAFKLPLTWFFFFNAIKLKQNLTSKLLPCHQSSEQALWSLPHFFVHLVAGNSLLSELPLTIAALFFMFPLWSQTCG